MYINSILQGNQKRVSDKLDLLTSLKDYFDIALFSKLNTGQTKKLNDKSFINNEIFWQEALCRNIYAGQIIMLKSFKILEWIPSSPGLYHTQFATDQRNYAIRNHFENEKTKGKNSNNSGFIELRPGDKRSMVKGGLGSLRIAPKKIGNDLKHIMCASSNGISHEGIVILIESDHYSKVISEIRDYKNPTANIIGRVMVLPEELSLISHKYYRQVPKFYLEVEKLEILKNDNPHQGVVSVAITYSSEDNLKANKEFSYSFCQFSPTVIKNDLIGITDWLKSYAIKYSRSESPIIIGDFDEFHNHFEKVQFPIADIANGVVSVDNLHKFQKLFNFTINETTMGDKNIFNNSQIGSVGSKAKSSNNKFEQKNYLIPKNLNYELLKKELENLKNELKSRANSDEEFIAINEIVQAEVAAKNKEGNKVIQHLLKGGKWIFDTATNIGVGIVVELIKSQTF